MCNIPFISMRDTFCGDTYGKQTGLFRSDHAKGQVRIMTLTKEELFDRAEQLTEQHSAEILEISRKIFENPERGYEEYQAADLLERTVTKRGFLACRGEGLLQTAIRAEHDPVPGRLNIGFISEYDALPNGHACGHNLIAASGVMSAVIFDELVREYGLGANAVFLGTPAEEGTSLKAAGGGGKIRMLDAGMFHGVDYAMMIHPCDSTMVEDWSLAGQGLTFRFYGKSAHCAASPWLGRNALAAAMETVNMVNAWRSQCKDYTRLFPNITHGGEATNVIPEFAELKYNVRSDDLEYHKELVRIVENCASCAAKAFGVTVEVERAMAYAPIRNNRKLEEHMAEAFQRLGETVIPRYRDHGIGSTDMGNVSQALPAIHGHLFLAKENTHTDAFREAAGGAAGKVYVIKAVKTMVMTAIGLICDPETAGR